MQMVVPSRVVNPSVLREWEEMHRPPPLDQPILPSGPVRGRRVVGMVNRQSNMLNKNRRVTCDEEVRRQWRRWKGRREGVTSKLSRFFCAFYRVLCRLVILCFNTREQCATTFILNIVLKMAMFNYQVPQPMG